MIRRARKETKYSLVAYWGDLVEKVEAFRNYFRMDHD